MSSPGPVDVRFATSAGYDPEVVLAFSAEHGFTRRSVDSWYGERMDAALAFHAETLIGAIPFACRSIHVAGQAPIDCGYLSGVVIRDDYRGAGLGGHLLQHLLTSYPNDGFVVNSFLDDAAYRWYARNGFKVAVPVRSVMGAVPDSVAQTSCEIEEISDRQLDANVSARLRALFDAQYGQASGFEVRDETFWNRRLRHHFYKAFNRYFLLMTADKSAYAVAALNEHPNACGQLDVLELCAGTHTQRDELIGGARTLAAGLGTRLLRVAVIVGSNLEAILFGSGFEESGRFDILFSGTGRRKVDLGPWTFFMWDYA